jgi:hypothetical protein
MMAVNDARMAISNAMQRARDLEEAAVAIRDQQASNRAGIDQLMMIAFLPSLRGVHRC